MPEPDNRHVVTLEINGTRKTVAVEARKLLVHLIREDLCLEAIRLTSLVAEHPAGDQP